MLVYWSPSLQEANTYAAGNTTEEAVMNLITNVADREVKRHGVDTLRNNPAWNLAKVAEVSNEQAVNAHIAIHSNAFKAGSQVLGAEVWAFSAGIKGDILARAIYKYVSALTPEADRGVKYSGYNLFETYGIKAPSCIVEVEFHDNITGATWILNNIDNIGIAIAKGVLEFLGIPYKPPQPPQTTNGIQAQLNEITLLKERIEALETNINEVVKQRDDLIWVKGENDKTIKALNEDIVKVKQKLATTYKATEQLFKYADEIRKACI